MKIRTTMFARTIGLCCLLALAASVALGANDVPIYKVDPFWPKMPLPNKYLIQGVPTMVTDKDDHIWVLNRPRDVNPDEIGAATNPPRTDCCVAAPAVLEFDTEGKLLKSWGAPGYTPGWPAQGVARPGAAAEHNIMVDREGTVWISGSSRGDSIQKFTSDVKFLWDFGHRGPTPKPGEKLEPLKQNNQKTDVFAGGIFFFDLDEDARELYIVDTKRVLVYDMDTGQFKRGWGGHGIPLGEIDNDPTPPYDISGPPPDQTQFAPALHCAHPSRDGLLYVCERGSDRVQVFTKQGKFVNEMFVHPSTQSRGPNCGGIWSTKAPPCGTVYNLTLSTDEQQKYLLVADGTNNMVWILDRNDGTLVGSFGGNGRYAGQLHWIDSIAMDSKGNVYTGEVEDGKRIQKFAPTNWEEVNRPPAVRDR